MKNKKQTKSDFLRSWGITDPNLLRAGFTWLRYKNPPEKGIYWYYFSKEIRHRDVKKYGTCISCGKPITFDTCDAGHYAPASGCGRDLLFDPMNVNAECGRCNAFDEGHLIGYEQGLITRYGMEETEKLKRRYLEYKNSDKVIKDWKAHEYEEKIRELLLISKS